MFPNFSGNSRRPRQVNLSGRYNTNPFANAVPGATGGSSSSSQVGQPLGRTNALANAQQDRLARQQERDRTQAATLVQKKWRGNVARKGVRAVQRGRWDEVEMRPRTDTDTTMVEDDEQEEGLSPYPSEADALSQLCMLLRFMDLHEEDDFFRLRRHFARLRATKGDKVDTTGPWPAAYLRLEQSCLNTFEREMIHIAQNGELEMRFGTLTDIIRFVVQRIPPEVQQYDYYYKRLAGIVKLHTIDMDLITMPLQMISSTTPQAYEQFSIHLLTLPSLFKAFNGAQGVTALAAGINCKLLGNALAEWLRRASQKDLAIPANLSTQQRSWLLGYFIYFYRHMYNFVEQERYSSNKDFVLVVGTLLSSLTEEIEVESAFSDADNESEAASSSRRTDALDPFVREQITSLVTQESVGGLLSLVENPWSDGEQSSQSNHSRILASYILTLLRLFPRRGDEIRMWLYLGLSSRRNKSGETLPVIRYFWQASASTHVFDAISTDPREAIRLLKPRSTSTLASSNRLASTSQSDTADEWRVILIFVELYMFVLKVMDDEEFFSGGRPMGATGRSSQSNTLTLAEVQRLTTFLKHLGFSMYYNAADILRHPDEKKQDESGELFRPRQLIAEKAETEAKRPELIGATPISGVQGMSLDYVKGLVTGLLRALYERDSRRPFLPEGHWLMTSRFDMTNFIDAVVHEEKSRQGVQEEDDNDNETNNHDMDVTESSFRSFPLIGTQHTQRLRASERVQRERRRASRKRFLQAVAPRLEILQNMPFLIPFTTRVKIFRRFVYMDQRTRRAGITDSELWRMQQMHGLNGDGNLNLARHHAKIRRDHEFEDAYRQFNDLGVALKEPIHITFVDKFDAVEAGIDGGGVTKEFLTSVTNQAFAPTEGIPLFVENEQHLLYPNPSAVDEQKELLREVGFKENQPTFRGQVLDLLQRYEFLGRIIGKCLYEGILVDIGFASFFLLKWALTGGTGSAPRESGYRANINDLRDFDEGLYQGLLQLKNYTGNVEDFSLNFTVTDTLTIPGPKGTTKSKTITRDLKPNGSSIAVTNANRLVYISYMARHRLQSQPYLQSTAFLRGLATIIEPSWLSMFNQSELQTLVGGAASQISVPDLRANTIYGGVYAIGDDGLEHESVRLFWQVMEDIDEDDRRKVLKFVTSTPRAPLLGFASLTPRFSIRDAGADESRLPSTSTCVNLLKLPRYSDLARCKAKLLQAVNAGAGFDLS